MVLFLFTSLCGHACEDLLDVHHLGIGVLAVDESGRKILAVGPYLGASHLNIIKRLSSEHPIRRLTWLGELKYRTGSNKLAITQANETSGLYSMGSSGIPMTNNFNSIPREWRARNFRGHHFSDSQLHLAEGLNVKDGNVRHNLSNAIASLSSAIHLLQRKGMSTKSRLELKEHIMRNEKTLILTVHWLLREILQSSEFEKHDLAEVQRAAEGFANPNLTLMQLQKLDILKLDEQTAQIREFLVRENENFLMKIFITRESPGMH